MPPSRWKPETDEERRERERRELEAAIEAARREMETNDKAGARCDGCGHLVNDCNCRGK